MYFKDLCTDVVSKYLLVESKGDTAYTKDVDCDANNAEIASKRTTKMTLGFGNPLKQKTNW